MDIRNGRSLDEMASVLENLKASGVAYQILYLEASDEVLVKRYKETRRAIPWPNRAGWRMVSASREKSFFI